MDLYAISLRLLCVYTLVLLGESARTSNLVYYNVISNSTGMCFRRFNATDQIGCSSGRSGNVGVVHYAANEDDLYWPTDVGPDPPYIILMDAELFQRNAKRLISRPNRVNGIVLLTSNTTRHPVSFSPDTKCPNSIWGAYYNDTNYSECSKQEFNQQGNGLMFVNYPFPVVSLFNTSVEDFLIKECFLKHNAYANDSLPGNLRCGMQIKDIMDGAKDTPTCHRRSNMVMNLSPQGYCDALGAENIFSFLRPMTHSGQKNVVIIAARYDSFSMFDGQYPGVDSAALSFVTVFAIAEALGRVKEQLNNFTDTQVMLVLFHGEAFDYIGSSRMVYDLQKDKLDLNFTVDDIKMFVELGQLGLHGSPESDKTIWMHTGLTESTEVENFKHLLETVGVNVSLVLKSPDKPQPLPPASLQSFVKARRDIPGVVLTNHQKEFTNQFYNSMYDTFSKAGLEYPESMNETEKYNYVGELARHLQKVSTVVAQAVYQVVTGNASVPDDCSSRNATVANLLYCLIVNPNCELLNSSYSSKTVAALRDKKKFLSRYVGVYGSQSNYDTLNIALFARFLGDPVENATESSCEQLQKNVTDGYAYFYMQGPLNESNPAARIPVCMRVAANRSAAQSPAFDIKNYNWSSNEYSAWTESRWGSGDALSVRVFLMPSYHQQVTVFLCGFVVLLLSFVLVFTVERNASVLFTTTS